MSLLPDWLATDTLMADDDDDERIPEGKSYKYDYKNKAVEITNSGRSVINTKEESYLWWCYKCLMEERYEHPFYSTDFGVEIMDILAADYPRLITESEIQRTIDEALIIDRRTVKTYDYRFEWTIDVLWISFVVDSIYGTHNFRIKRGV